MIRWLRLNLVPKILRLGSGNLSVRRKMFRLISQLGISYPNSPLNIRDNKKQFAEGIKPGERAADGRLKCKHKSLQLFDLINTKHYSLILFAQNLSDHDINQAKNQLASLIEKYPITLQVISSRSESTYPCDNSDELHRHYGIRQPSLYMIRPDGHVISRQGNADVMTFQAQLKQIFDA